MERVEEKEVVRAVGEMGKKYAEQRDIYKAAKGFILVRILLGDIYIVYSIRVVPCVSMV